VIVPADWLKETRWYVPVVVGACPNTIGTLLAPVAALLPLELQPKIAIPVGLALAWLGYALWSERRAQFSEEQTAQPVPGKVSPQLSRTATR